MVQRQLRMRGLYALDLARRPKLAPFFRGWRSSCARAQRCCNLQSMDPDDDRVIVARSRVKPDGEMTEARLLELIALDEEEDALDFKRTYDLSTPQGPR
jgi:hypothetical protein